MTEAGGERNMFGHAFGLCLDGGTGDIAHEWPSLEDESLEVDSGVLGSDGSNTDVSHNPWSLGSMSAKGAL